MGQKPGNGLGGVLHVGVHQHDGVAAGVGQAGLHGRLVAEVPRKMDHPNPLAGGSQLIEHLRAFVARSVVNEDQFVGHGAGVQHPGNTCGQDGQDLGLVVDRQYDAQ